jgi:hypothetical protein
MLPGFLKIKIRPLGSHRNAFGSPSAPLATGAQGGWWAQHCEHRPWSLASRPVQSLFLGLSNAHLRSISLPSLLGACLPNFSTDPYTVAWEGRSRELWARSNCAERVRPSGQWTCPGSFDHLVGAGIHRRGLRVGSAVRQPADPASVATWGRSGCLSGGGRCEFGADPDRMLLQTIVFEARKPRDSSYRGSPPGGTSRRSTDLKRGRLDRG